MIFGMPRLSQIEAVTQTQDTRPPHLEKTRFVLDNTSTIFSLGEDTPFFSVVWQGIKDFFSRFIEMIREIFIYPWWCILPLDKKLERLAFDFEKKKSKLSPEKFSSWWEKCWIRLELDLKKIITNSFLNKYSLYSQLFPKNPQNKEIDPQVQFVIKTIKNLSYLTLPGGAKVDLKEDLPCLLKASAKEIRK